MKETKFERGKPGREKKKKEHECNIYQAHKLLTIRLQKLTTTHI